MTSSKSKHPGVKTAARFLPPVFGALCAPLRALVSVGAIIEPIVNNKNG